MKISSYMEGVFENSDLTQGEIDYILENVRRLEAVAVAAKPTVELCVSILTWKHEKEIPLWVREAIPLVEAYRALEDADG